MNPFTYVPVQDVTQALWHAGEGTRFIAGGTNLVDLMKVRVLRPLRLVDVNRIGFDAIEPDAGSPTRTRSRATNARCIRRCSARCAWTRRWERCASRGW